jgi:hypothetical protein
MIKIWKLTIHIEKARNYVTRRQKFSATLNSDNSNMTSIAAVRLNVILGRQYLLSR